MDISHFVLLLWMALVLYATGQIWFAQIVVYPLFAMVGEKDYVQYHHFYSSHIPMPVILPGFSCCRWRCPSADLARSPRHSIGSISLWVLPG